MLKAYRAEMNTIRPPTDMNDISAWENEGGAQPDTAREYTARWKRELAKHWHSYVPTPETVARTEEAKRQRTYRRRHGRGVSPPWQL
ncbi:hypothetical protein MPMin1_gp74 [Microbacterium phage Min1]|uniref:Uncharacterized protein n=1 Tax=Microbacterium phage Min1 TaxID=446529 RepID=A6N232_9CAUD|nr:hypothetical protein MPMin1_gp74 [Microbacterium phage Min1]ABR10504.1 hypothetical protein [Microbacterium phage Min1]MBG9887460.1 hypothetical protein [Bacillus toyonensis]